MEIKDGTNYETRCGRIVMILSLFDPCQDDEEKTILACDVKSGTELWYDNNGRFINDEIESSWDLMKEV